ncbi:MAG TPA: protein kinase [Gemmatimonadaceae bacterium]|jgi:serine/threonine-protein kinase
MTAAGLREQLQATLGECYAIERELGGGGMSRVFVARDVTLGRDVVVKVIAPENAEGLSAERFAREVKLAARLQQANIVPVLAAGTSGTLPYYTMPFVRGESLRARLATGAVLGIPEAVSILRDVARALAYAHAEHVVHRDIKPENILLSGGAAVVTDFGIAKAIDASRTLDAGSTTGITMAGVSLGTPAYMAPEQALGDPGTDQRADIYAWGVVAWELLGGAHPFAERKTMQALITAHVTETPPSLTERRPEVPDALAALVMRCLEKNPENRPHSADELLAAVESVNTSRESVAAPVVAQKHWKRAIPVAATLVVVIASALVVQHFRHVVPATTDKSLAVLPFTTSGGDTANTYLAEGIADEVNNTLSQIPGLRIAGRSSAARFARSNGTPQEAGAALKVASVLDGTVRREGDQIRITAELSNTGDGTVAWHESYTRAAKDIFAVQDEIARAIAGQLQVTLGNAGAASLAASGTRDATAYDLYLKGMYLYRRRGPGIADAISTLDQATAQDSTFARAWAGLSNALTVSPSYLNTHAGDVLPRARQAAERAIRLDSALSDGYMALGYVDAEQFQWKAAESELRRAIALDPNNAEARYRLGYTLFNQGRVTDAIPQFRSAEARDPLYFLPAIYLGWAEVRTGQIPEGIAEIRRGLGLEPQSITGLCLIALAYDRAGLPDSARLYAHRILETSSQPARIGEAAYVLARNGDRHTAELLTRQLEATPENAWTRWTALSLAYNGLGDTTRAFAAMDRAAAGDGDEWPTFGITYARDLSPSSRVAAVLRRYNLDPANLMARPGTTRSAQ